MLPLMLMAMTMMMMMMMVVDDDDDDEDDDDDDDGGGGGGRARWDGCSWGSTCLGAVAANVDSSVVVISNLIRKQ